MNSAHVMPERGRKSPTRRLVWLSARGAVIALAAVLGATVAEPSPAYAAERAGAGGLERAVRRHVLDARRQAPPTA
jgi:hypothetical protein